MVENEMKKQFGEKIEQLQKEIFELQSMRNAQANIEKDMVVKFQDQAEERVQRAIEDANEYSLQLADQLSYLQSENEQLYTKVEILVHEN